MHYSMLGNVYENITKRSMFLLQANYYSLFIGILLLVATLPLVTLKQTCFVLLGILLVEGPEYQNIYLATSLHYKLGDP